MFINIDNSEYCDIFKMFSNLLCQKISNQKITTIYNDLNLRIFSFQSPLMHLKSWDDLGKNAG